MNSLPTHNYEILHSGGQVMSAENRNNPAEQSQFEQYLPFQTRAWGTGVEEWAALCWGHGKREDGGERWGRGGLLDLV